MPWFSGLLVSLSPNLGDHILADPFENGFAVFLIGGLSLLMVYHLFLYFQNKDNTYLLYASYLLFLILSQNRHITSGFISSGFSVLGEWRYHIVFYTEIGYILYFFFAYRFLNVKQEFPRYYSYLKFALYGIIAYSVGHFIAYLILDDFILDQKLYLFFVGYVLILSIASYWIFFKSKSTVKYYLIVGSLLLLIFSFASFLAFGILKTQGRVAMSSYTLLYIGFIAENIVFSLGLGRKQKLIQDERNRVQQELIDQLKENEELEVNFRAKLEEEIIQLKEKLEKDTRERLSVHYEKELSELKLASLRNQMNPHFIFNSLNSIKRFIIDKNQDDALFYLNKFSKLVRKILTTSIEKDISLAEELEIAQLYMQLENIRFDNEIEYDLQADKALAINAIKVPALIFQPFLENAIWHGLSSKNGAKWVLLSIHKRNDMMEVIVADNGIGRAAAEKIKARKLTKRRSYGLKLTEERLRNYCRANQGYYSLEFEDLHGENGEPTGTKAKIQLSIIYN